MSRGKGGGRVPFSSHRFLFLSVGTLRSDDATATRTSKTTIDLVSKTTTLHVHLTFLCISLPFLHYWDVKLPNFTFSGGRKQATTKFYSLSKLEYGVLGIQLREGSPTFGKVSELQ